MNDIPPKATAPKIGFVSLGCPKALVDSERIITRLRAEGYELSASYQDADAVVVNTCGFLDSAKAESLAAIGEALRENGRVIVTGCLGVESERIRAAHPQVLAITGPHQYEAVVAEVHKAVPRPHDPFLDLVPPQGIRLTPRHYAYVKISEGCNNKCSFCIIPSLRGRLKSRSLGDVMREAERLVAAGVQELLVISQDTSAYGLDLGYAKSAWRGEEHETRFLSLAEALGSLGAAALRLSLSPCRSGLAADGRGPRAALSRHSFPACEPQSPEGDAAPRASGEDASTHRPLARNLPRPCRPLDLHRWLPRRDRG
jgi:ribosomal protein S12 methylthiotransferase